MSLVTSFHSSTMTTLSNLPGELISQIVSLSILNKRTDVCSLRLVSRSLNDWATPTLFSTLVLKFANSSDFTRCLDIVTALASGSTRVFEHTRELQFSSHHLFQGRGNVSIIQVLLENIFNAISALRSLETVNWFYYPRYDPVGLANAFTRALGTIPTFHSFGGLYILTAPPPTFSLQPLSGLRAITCSSGWQGPHLISEIASLLARCPDISCFRFNGDSFARFADLFAEVNKSGQSLPLKRLCLAEVSVIADDIENNIRHLRCLESLSISRNLKNSATASEEIYTVLGRHDVFLKELNVEINPFILDYIASYSGLRDLRLAVGHPSLEDSPAVVDRFYKGLLPLHQETLEQLEIVSTLPSVWTKLPSMDHLREVAKCRRLRRLTIWSGVDEAKPERSYIAACDAWLTVGAQLPELTDLCIKFPSDAPPFEDPEVDAGDLLLAALSRIRRETGKRFLVNSL
ncbi:hypothetical protein P691DRAFT_771188 [Macrolepiota fuliginosa MF-IS2]|uniref:F-box domain-containing protein n=1 Tax=Macrolepiota fuliginosa MF-IS2 TaxID=1400762 RepID=A0A9P5XMN1_9AGAR|nr:hypothetical protein P691DRAFT_771188 [Macrolepiota fuliginosa MF-IS2]